MNYSGKAFACVLFDWDSTLSTLEGIDILAEALPPNEQQRVRQATTEAMAGRRPLNEVYELRLDAIRPHENRLRRLAAQYFEHRVADATEVVAALQSLGKSVGVISGGLRPAVLGAATRMGIPAEWVHAVEVQFNPDGSYLDFNRRSPLWQNGGKALLLESLPQLPRPLALVGDGITDLETVAHVELFLGFGGVVRREAVERAATRYIDEPRLAPVLAELITPSERNDLLRNPEFAALVHHSE